MRLFDSSQTQTAIKVALTRGLPRTVTAANPACALIQPKISPAEDFLDPLAATQADPMAAVAGGAPVDRGFADLAQPRYGAVDGDRGG